MISALYDPAVLQMMSTKKDILTGCVGVDVQAVIERPYLYILGQSKSSDVDQSSYTATSLEA